MAQENERTRFAESVRIQLNEWVQLLGDDGISAAAERVNKASSMVSNTISGAQGIAQGGITGAVSCMNQDLQGAQSAEGNAVDRGDSSAPPAQQPSAGGGMSGATIGLAVAGAGAGLAAFWVRDESRRGNVGAGAGDRSGASGGRRRWWIFYTGHGQWNVHVHAVVGW